MSMEPDDHARRLNAVTAHTARAERAHDTHDRLLVARFALGDELASDERATVRALLATCGDCQELMGEMQVVQHATAASLAPARPRDFFITTEQAATLRPNAWQRLLGRFSAPRVTVLRPLAGATLAIGIVLVGAGAVLPRDQQVQDPVAASETAGLREAASPEAVDNSAGAMMSDVGPSAAPQARGTDMTAKASTSPFSVEMAPDPSAQPREMLVPGSPAATTTAFMVPGPSTAPDQTTADGALTAQAAPSQDVAGPALLLLGLVLAVVSGLVLILAWLARRTVDPLLR